MIEKTIEINYHKTQNEVFSHPARYKIITCGRRWGKTRGSINWSVENNIYDNPSDKLIWWVAPIYSQAITAFNYLKSLYVDAIGYKNESKLIIELLNGSKFEFKSADKPDNLRSEGLDYLVMDECAMMKAEAWHEVLRPATLERKAPVCFISTPKGMNWFYDLYEKGLDPFETDYQSFHFTTYDNPYIEHEEIEKAKKEMPAREFEQEIMANFVEDIGGVFRNVRGCIGGSLQEPVVGERYLMGVDLGKYQDFTVLCMVDNNGQLVAYDRFNEISWSLQEQRILNMAEKYKANILIDQGQVGDAILESLREKYTNIWGIKFNNENKTAMINYLSNRVEKQTIHYPEIPELINELRIYEYEMLPSGRLRMNAPAGRHDDIVIALALAVWQLKGAGFNFSSEDKPIQGLRSNK